MDISYKGTWGYHPLLATLAETGEVLRLVNRSGKASVPGGQRILAFSGAIGRSAAFRLPPMAYGSLRDVGRVRSLVSSVKADLKRT